MGARRTGRRLELVNGVLAAAGAAAVMVGVVVGGLGVGSLGGCVGYSAAPLTKEETVFSDPNAPSSRHVETVALQWVVRRYPPEGGDGRLKVWQAPKAGEDFVPRFAINLPDGTKADGYARVARDVGMGAVALTPDNVDLPTYHVGRVWVMGDEATVDIWRPVPEMGGGPDGKTVYQGMTIRLRGGFKPWAVRDHKAWTLGAMPPPAPYYIPGSVPVTDVAGAEAPTGN